MATHEPLDNLPLAEVLRAAKYHVAEVKGHTVDGDQTILCVEVARREAQKLIHLATAADERCLCIVHDLRLVDFARRGVAKANKHKRSWLFPLEGLAALKRGIS